MNNKTSNFLLLSHITEIDQLIAIKVRLFLLIIKTHIRNEKKNREVL